MATAEDRAPHRHAVRVYFEDTDAGGIVYHASYLRFAERARTEMLRSLGFDHGRLRAQMGVLFAVRRCVADFRAPARLDDALEVQSAVARLRGASIKLQQAILRRESLLVQLEVDLAVIDQRLRPVRLPRSLREAFGKLRPDLLRAGANGRDHA